MSDIDHLPVRPNINSNGFQKSNRSRISNETSRPSLFENNKDPDIQKFITKKKTDALEINSPRTKEEKQSKEQKDDTPKKEGYSWVVIGLAIVIIILIIIVIYYVLKYNESSNDPVPIPASVVKPSVQNGIIGAASIKVDRKGAENIASKQDLDSVLSRLSTIQEDSEPSTLERPSAPEPEIEKSVSFSEIPIIKVIKVERFPQAAQIQEIESDGELDNESDKEADNESDNESELEYEQPSSEDKVINNNENDIIQSGFMLDEDYDEEELNTEMLKSVLDLDDQ
jgi:hypothetical protein